MTRYHRAEGADDHVAADAGPQGDVAAGIGQLHVGGIVGDRDAELLSGRLRDARTEILRLGGMSHGRDDPGQGEDEGTEDGPGSGPGPSVSRISLLATGYGRVASVRFEARRRFRAHWSWVFAPVWVLLGPMTWMTPAFAAALPVSSRVFTVIAHRGNHASAHENTIRAIELAVAIGADYVEIDVRRTRDGHHVLMHDATVDRCTDGHGALAGLTLAEVRDLWVRDPARPRLTADRVPTLREAFGACRGRIHVYLDFKDGDRAQVIQEIQEAGMSRRVLVYCRPVDIPRWRALEPALPLIVSPPRELAAAPGPLVDWIRRNRVEVLDGDWISYTRASVEAAEKVGAKVWPDIQDMEENPEAWEKVMAVGFSGAQTDKPSELLAWLRGRRPLPGSGSPDR